MIKIIDTEADKLHRVQRSYHQYWEDVKDLVDKNGWIRISSKTPAGFLAYFRGARELFERRSELTYRGIRTYARPKILRNKYTYNKDKFLCPSTP